jgi:hypothetical protein
MTTIFGCPPGLLSKTDLGKLFQTENPLFNLWKLGTNARSHAVLRMMIWFASYNIFVFLGPQSFTKLLQVLNISHSEYVSILYKLIDDNELCLINFL